MSRLGRQYGANFDYNAKLSQEKMSAAGLSHKNVVLQTISLMEVVFFSSLVSHVTYLCPE